MRECDFCNELAGGAKNGFTPSDMDATWFGQNLLFLKQISSGLSLAPGQIVEGHLLISSAAHYRALADMPDEAIRELDNLVQQVRLILSQSYGKCIFL